MERTERLSPETRKCPVCRNDDMRATRVGLGGGWSKTGLRFVFSCSACGHQTVLERRGTRNSAAVAGLVIVIVCAVIALTADGVDLLGMAVLAFFGLMGGGAIAAALTPERRYPVTGELPEREVRSASVEEDLYLSDDEKVRGDAWQKRGQVAIYTILALTAAWFIYSLFSEGR